MFFKKPIIRDEKHRRFIASLPCCVSGLENSSQCAHVRSGGNAGMGLKPGDDFCVPLWWKMHDEQHRTSEQIFWRKFGGVDKAKELARELYRNTGKREKSIALLHEFRRCENG